MAKNVGQRYLDWIIAQIKLAGTIEEVKRLMGLAPLDSLVEAAGNSRWDELTLESLEQAASVYLCRRQYSESRPDSSARVVMEQVWANLALCYLASLSDEQVGTCVMFSYLPVNSPAWHIGLERYLRLCTSYEQVHRIDDYLLAPEARPSPELMECYWLSCVNHSRKASQAAASCRMLRLVGSQHEHHAVRQWDKLSLAEVEAARGDLELVKAYRAAREGSEARQRIRERWEAMQMSRIQATHLHPRDLRSSLVSLLRGLEEFSDLQTEGIHQEACRKLIELSSSATEAMQVFDYLPKDSPDLTEAACQRLLDLSLSLADCLHALNIHHWKMSYDWRSAIFKRALGLCRTPTDAANLAAKVENEPNLKRLVNRKLSELLKAAGC